MVAGDNFAEFLREQLAPLGRVTMRRMFGKTGVFCAGLMFGMVTDDTLYFRVDDHNRAAFKEAESFPPLNRFYINLESTRQGFLMASLTYLQEAPALAEMIYR
jgi:hypothetical protein